MCSIITLYADSEQCNIHARITLLVPEKILIMNKSLHFSEVDYFHWLLFLDICGYVPQVFADQQSNEPAVTSGTQSEYD